MIIQGINKTYNIDVSEDIWNMVIMAQDYKKILDPSDIQNTYGVYIWFDADDKPIRIGKAVKLRNRILGYATSQYNDYVWAKMYNEVSFVSVIYTTGEKENRAIEYDLLQKHRPKYNVHDIN